MAKKKKAQRKKASKPKLERDSYHLPVRSEEEQFEGLPEDLHEAWRHLRRFLISLGEQEVRTSHRAIMFARRLCYAFVRPKKSYLEINFFLPNALDSGLLSKVNAVSKTRYAHVMKVTHSDQVDEPLTDWIREAFTHST